MNLIEIYETAIVSKDYSVFKSAIDKQMNGIPETVISTNEFKLINVSLGDISVSLDKMKDTLLEKLGELMYLRDNAYDWFLKRGYQNKIDAIETLLEPVPYDADDIL